MGREKNERQRTGEAQGKGFGVKNILSGPACRRVPIAPQVPTSCLQFRCLFVSVCCCCSVGGFRRKNFAACSPRVLVTVVESQTLSVAASATAATAATTPPISTPDAATIPRLRVADKGAPDPTALHLKTPESISAALLGHEDLAAKAPDVDGQLVTPAGVQPNINANAGNVLVQRLEG